MPVMVGIGSTLGGEMNKSFFNAMSETEFESELMEAKYAAKREMNSYKQNPPEFGKG